MSASFSAGTLLGARIRLNIGFDNLTGQRPFREMPPVEIQCATWEEFQRGVRDLAKFEGQYVFRGQGNAAWRLQSIWQREDHGRYWSLPDSIRESKKREFVEKFKTLAIRSPATPDAATEKEWMMLGRHHGLVTPLLDWTTSPYIAAFFAFAQREEEHLRNSETTNVAVWAMPQALGARNNEEFWFEFESKSCRHRQNAQCGAFTYLFAKDYDCLEMYLDDNESEHVLTKFTIDATEGQKALHDLFLMNINFATAFPDLDGAAKEANRRSWYIDGRKFGFSR